MKVRRAKLSDLDEVFKLRKETFMKINSKDYTEEEINDINSDSTLDKLKDKIKSREMFCLVENDDIIGVIDLKGNKIGGFFIRPDKIGKGHGKKLLLFIEDHCRKKGIRKVILYSTFYAEGFYKKFGYSYPEGKRKVNKSEGHYNIRMEKKLE